MLCIDHKVPIYAKKEKLKMKTIATFTDSPPCSKIYQTSTEKDLTELWKSKRTPICGSYHRIFINRFEHRLH